MSDEESKKPKRVNPRTL